MKGERIEGATSQSYKKLITASPDFIDPYKEKWEKELGCLITPAQWEKACCFSHKCSLSTKIQETSYKIRTQWYRTPVVLHRWSEQNTSICWRCGSSQGTFLHIWWDCPVIESFWKEISKWTRHITETTLNLDAACCLLHINHFPYRKYKKSLTRHMLNAAKSLIPIHWNTKVAPTTKDWLDRIGYIYEMEETVAIKLERNDIFQKMWSPWKTFTVSSDYKDLMAA